MCAYVWALFDGCMEVFLLKANVSFEYVHLSFHYMRRCTAIRRLPSGSLRTLFKIFCMYVTPLVVHVTLLVVVALCAICRSTYRIAVRVSWIYRHV